MTPYLNPFTICQIANRLILERGYDEVAMADIAAGAGVDTAEIYKYFGTKQDIILFVFQSINTDWQQAVSDITARKLTDRFEQAMMAKLEIMQPYSALLGSIMGQLMQSTRVGVQAPRTSHIRAIGMQIMQTIVDEATDSKTLKRKIPQLSSALYILHWAILFLSIHTGNDNEKTLGAVRLAARIIRQAGHVSQILGLFPLFSEINAWSAGMLPESAQQDYSLVREILKIIFNNRKTSEALPECLLNKCETCMNIHQMRVNYFTSQGKPLQFILPAFPAKSPNSNKVLGTLPDLGEEIALSALEDVCKEIEMVYKPGAHITICSDGRIFSELVGVTDQHVTDYVTGIRAIISQLDLKHVDIVNLEDLIQGASFDDLRNMVLDSYAEPLEDLQVRLKSSSDFKVLFNGIHRFITEDRKDMHPELSANKVKQESVGIALKVIQYSNAWTRFLSYVYPDAIRLSIHPYPAHSDKIGIRLTKATDNWLTPWHGVIVLQEDGYVLMKKHEALAAGARLVSNDRRPYYFSLIPE